MLGMAKNFQNGSTKKCWLPLVSSVVHIFFSIMLTSYVLMLAFQALLVAPFLQIYFTLFLYSYFVKIGTVHGSVLLRAIVSSWWNYLWYVPAKICFLFVHI